jgi:hypothetical protein
MVRRSRSRSRGWGGGGKTYLLFGAVVLLLVSLAAVPSSSFTSVAVDRPSSAEVVTDSNGLVKMGIDQELSCEEYEQDLLTVTNQFETTIDPSITFSDPVYLESNLQPLAPGESTTVRVDISSVCSDLKDSSLTERHVDFELSAEADGVTAVAERSFKIVAAPDDDGKAVSFVAFCAGGEAAKFEYDEGSDAFLPEGDGTLANAVTITNTSNYDEDGPRTVTWRSETEVDTVVVKAGTRMSNHPGGTSGVVTSGGGSDAGADQTPSSPCPGDDSDGGDDSGGSDGDGNVCGLSVGADEKAVNVSTQDDSAGATTPHRVCYGIAVGSDTAGNSLNSIVVDYPSGSVDLSDVDTRADVTTVGIDTDRDGTIDVDVRSSPDDLECCPPGDGVKISNGGTAIDIELTGNYDLEGGYVVIAEYQDVENPSPGNYPVTVGLNGDVTGSTTIDITGGPGNGGPPSKAGPSDG